MKRKAGRIAGMVQICVKLDGSKAFPLYMSLSDKDSDIVRRILDSACCSKRDVYVTGQGRVIRRSVELYMKRWSTVQVMSKMSGGGKHNDKNEQSEEEETSRQPKETGAGANTTRVEE